MKKFFTLCAVALAAMSVNAQDYEELYKIDFSQFNNMPFYVMGYLLESTDEGTMVDNGSSYLYKEAAKAVADDDDLEGATLVTTNAGAEYYRWTEGGGWHQYFIIDWFNCEDGDDLDFYVVAKADEEVTVIANFMWGWGEGQSISSTVTIGTEWGAYGCKYEACGATESGTNSVVFQPAMSTTRIEYKLATIGKGEYVYEEEEAALASVKSSNNSVMYNILGQKVNEAKGLVIKNGVKTVIK